ncbi:MAG: sugar ABC transporter ATP-binding protein [Candidatus Limiplasma sp.]|nr:sugar ABC transporter ATP-binding protein [Candidatus Limiplasma sp.]
MEYILEMQGICKSFFGVQVLREACLQVKPGEVHVLLGENGAGKSTLIKILSGAYKREVGEITLNGKPLVVTTPKEALDAGISVIYQEFNLVPHLPIYENIFIGKEPLRHGLLDRKTAIEQTQKYLDRIGLKVDPRTCVCNLSVAQKQMVEICKALSNDSKVLVLDEPTSAITANETKTLFEIIRKLKAEGLGIIYISHRMSELFEIGDRVTIMRDGCYVSTCALKDTNERELPKMMVGREVCFDKIVNEGLCPDQVAMEVKNISWRDRVKNVSFTLRKGEILGVSGLVGAGRTELAKCIIGAYKHTGEVLVDGKPLKGGIPQAIRSGVVYLSEDRKDEGLVLMHTIRENIALPNLRQFGRVLLRKREISQKSREYMEKLRVKAPNDQLEAKNLSGGNQQKVVIAKWLLNQPKVYIFDEPTRGIDVGARDEIYHIMEDLTRNGASILMISSDMVEVMKMWDRIAVMHEGEMPAILENDGTVTEEKILSYTLNGGNEDEAAVG